MAANNNLQSFNFYQFILMYNVSRTIYNLRMKNKFNMPCMEETWSGSQVSNVVDRTCKLSRSMGACSVYKCNVRYHTVEKGSCIYYWWVECLTRSRSPKKLVPEICAPQDFGVFQSNACKWKCQDSRLPTVELCTRYRWYKYYSEKCLWHTLYLEILLLFA